MAGRVKAHGVAGNRRCTTRRACHRKLPGKLRWRPDFRHPAVRKLARLSLWTFGYVVANQISFGVGLNNQSGDAPVDNSLFEAPAWDPAQYQFEDFADIINPTRRATHEVMFRDERPDLSQTKEDGESWRCV